MKCPSDVLFKKQTLVGFWPGTCRRKIPFRTGLYARVSTHDQQIVPMEKRALREYAARRGWTLAMQSKEVGSGATQREAPEKLLGPPVARRSIPCWSGGGSLGRSVTDLLSTLQELEHLGVGFVSLTGALDLTTPTGRAMAGLVAAFAEFSARFARAGAGLAHARHNGKRLGRPATVALHADQIRKLHRFGLSKSAVARRLDIGRTSGRRILKERIR